MIMAGGEAGLVRSWWTGPFEREWRRSLGLYSHR